MLTDVSISHDDRCLAASTAYRIVQSKFVAILLCAFISSNVDGVRHGIRRSSRQMVFQEVSNYGWVCIACFVPFLCIFVAVCLAVDVCISFLPALLMIMCKVVVLFASSL
jgi:hypothetical protein